MDLSKYRSTLLDNQLSAYFDTPQAANILGVIGAVGLILGVVILLALLERKFLIAGITGLLAIGGFFISDHVYQTALDQQTALKAEYKEKQAAVVAEAIEIVEKTYPVIIPAHHQRSLLDGEEVPAELNGKVTKVSLDLDIAGEKEVLYAGGYEVPSTNALTE